MHRLVNEFDWASTPIGPIEKWPESLKTLSRAILSSRYPMCIIWGPKFIPIYNDFYFPLVGEKHPSLLGNPFDEISSDAWPVVGSLIESVLETGESVSFPDFQIPLERKGFLEETYFSMSLSAAPDDAGRVGGVFAIGNDITDQIIGIRRLELLTQLSIKSEAIHSIGEMCVGLCDSIMQHCLDVPFVSLFLKDESGLQHVGGNSTHPLQDHTAWPTDRVLTENVSVVYDVGSLGLTGGPWANTVQQAVVAPIRSNSTNALIGVMILGVSPNHELDEKCRSFVDTIVRQVAVALSNADAYQRERERVAALEQLDRVKTAFFSNMSHEMRTPMNAIVGGSSLMLDTELNTEQRGLAEMVQSSAESLITIINEVLDYSKLEAGKFEFACEPYDVRKCITESLNVVSLRANEKHILLTTELSESVPRYLLGDANRLRQVLLNLLSNAVKFTNTGVVATAATYSNGILRVSVSDTGIGIPSDRLESVFDAFSQLDNKVSSGTGLGLSIARSLVRGMRGEIEVTSNLAKGSQFVVSIPAQVTIREPVVVETQVVDRNLAERIPLRILIAEDHPVNQRVLSAMLGRLGYCADVVDTGTAAVEAATRGAYDLVLMDAQMPEMDGLTAAAEIVRQMPTGLRPRIVAVTANAMLEDRERALAAGMSGYISKPVTSRALVSLLTEAATTSSPDESTSSPVIFDRERLAPLTSNRPELLVNLIDTYLANASDLIDLAEKSAHSPEELFSVLHRLKGSSATIGANALAALCAEIDIQDVDAVLKIREEFERLKAALDRERDAQSLNFRN